MASSFVRFNHTRQSYDRASEKLNLTGIDQDSEARPDDDISKTLRKHGIPVARQELASLEPGPCPSHGFRRAIDAYQGVPFSSVRKTGQTNHEISRGSHPRRVGAKGCRRCCCSSGA